MKVTGRYSSDLGASKVVRTPQKFHRGSGFLIGLSFLPDPSRIGSSILEIELRH